MYVSTCVSVYLCIYVSLHLCIYVSLYLCIYVETWSGESQAGLDSMHENRQRRPKAEDRWLCKSERTDSEAESRRPKAKKTVGKQGAKTKSRKPNPENRKPKKPWRNPKETSKKPSTNPQNETWETVEKRANTPCRPHPFYAGFH